jgi:hypothetical protein
MLLHAFLLSSAKCHKSYSNFFLITDLFLFDSLWVSSGLIMISSYVEVVTYIIDSLGIFQRTSSSCCHHNRNPYLVIIL